MGQSDENKISNRVFNDIMVQIGQETFTSIIYCLEIIGSAFYLVGKWVSWKIGNVINVRIGEDPWIGCKGNYKLSHACLEALSEAYSQLLRNVWL